MIKFRFSGFKVEKGAKRIGRRPGQGAFAGAPMSDDDGGDGKGLILCCQH